MTGLDVEAVLRDHEWQPTTEPYGWCACGESHKRVSHRAHVAAVLRVEIESALGDAWDAGHRGLCRRHGSVPFAACTNPYRPTLAADEGECAMSERPDQNTEDYRRYAVLFNDITHAPVDHIHFRDRQALADYLWDQGWRREVRSEDVTEVDPRAGSAFVPDPA